MMPASQSKTARTILEISLGLVIIGPGSCAIAKNGNSKEIPKAAPTAYLPILSLSNVLIFFINYLMINSDASVGVPTFTSGLLIFIDLRLKIAF